MSYYYKMLIAFAINAVTFHASGQLTAAISQDMTICAGSTATLTLTGSGGVAPYTFSYTVDGGAINSISSGAGNTADFSVVFPQPGTVHYTLVSVEDATTTTALLNLDATVTVVANPVIDAGPDQTICSGSAVTFAISGTWGCTYTWSGGVMGNTPFTPTATTTYFVSGSCNGCTATDQVTVNVIPFDHPTATATIDSATCHDGSVAITISGNNPPYAVEWDNLSTGAMMSPLTSGNYTATITDGSGCVMDTSFTVPASLLPSDCGTISGSVHYDENQDCVTDAGDAPIGNRMIIANPGNFVTFTDPAGNYELHLYPGAYTIEEAFNNTGFGPMCNASQPVNLSSGQTVSGIDFLDTISGGADFQVNSSSSIPMFMSNLVCQLTITDLTGYQGLDNLTGWFTIPPQLTLVPWNVPHTISNDTVYYAVDSSAISITDYVDFDLSNVELGDTVSFCSGVISSLPEENLTNNTYCQNGIVIGPYDPNDITMFLNGVPSDSTILATDMTLDYRIRFQNTGTAEAINVYVLDTISDYLDLSSFQLISASHNCQVSAMDGQVLKFDFPLIHLPDSNANEAASHGYIHYRVRQKPANPIGTIIHNTAYIYFDFNEAVITNTSYDLIVDDLGVQETSLKSRFTMYPNPTKGEVFMAIHQAGLSQGEIEVTDLNGKIVYSSRVLEIVDGTGRFNLTVDSGIYLVHFTNPLTHETAVTKLVVQN